MTTTKTTATFQGAPIVDRYKINLAFAAAVAQELGDEWSVRPATTIELEDDGAGATYRQSPGLVGPDGVNVYLCAQSKGNALLTTVRGDAWREIHARRRDNSSGYSYDTPSIGVDFGRGPAAVAKAIRSRLLPDFVPSLLAMRARLDAEDAAKAKTEGLAAELGEAFALERYNVHERSLTAPAKLRRELPGGVSVSVDVDGTDGSVTVSGLSHDAIRALLAHLGAGTPPTFTDADARELAAAHETLAEGPREDEHPRNWEHRQARIVSHIARLETARGRWERHTAATKGAK